MTFITKSIVSVPLADSAGYEYFFDPSTSTTTSTGWVNKLQVTTNPLDTGRYLLAWGLEIGQTGRNSTAGYRVRWRENGVTAFANAVENPVVSFRDPSFIAQSNTIEIPVTVNQSTVTVQAQFGQTVGGSANLRNVIYYIFKVGDL